MFEFNTYFTDSSILKRVIKDNLVWLRTLVEDRYDQIYDKHMFFNKKLDNAYNPIIRMARVANYLS